MKGALSREARAALEQAGLSRRRFLKGSGALIVSFATFRLAGGSGMASDPLRAQGINGPGDDRLDAWIAIREDGSVTAYTGKCEFGQGLYTAQTQLVAEELSVPLPRVTLVQCDTALTPDQGTTSGSQSHPANFNQVNLGKAAATARQALLDLGAARLRVPVRELHASDGLVVVTRDPSRTVSYGSLVGGRRFNLTLGGSTAARKHPSEWRILGTSVPRLEVPALLTGRFEFAHNVRLPGMLHGRVVRPPVVGATLVGVNERSVRDLPGLVQVVVKRNFVGVVADKPWQAVQAARQLDVTWTAGVALPPHAGFPDYLRRQTPARDTLVVDSTDVDDTSARAAQIVRATYYVPYQMHASIASSCAVADVRGETATIWSSTQALYPQKATAAMVLGLPPENVRVIYKMGSGCYGINGADTVSYDAALLSQAVGRPVRVQLTRKDEMAWENYGWPYVLDQRVALDAEGRIVAWDHESWSASLGGRPGNSRPMSPGSVITGFLAGFPPAPFMPRSPAPPPAGRLNNGGNDAPSYVAGCVDGACGGTGTVASERVLTHVVASPFWTGHLRSPARLQNTFAHECMIDEVAARVRVDPMEYRRRHLRDPRLIGVVNAAAKAANWDARPSPRDGQRGAGTASGRGAACVLYEGDNGYCAMVAEVDVHQDTGRVAVKRLVIAMDCGPISNPDGLRNQAEGGALQGMSRALTEEVTWDDRQITSVDWRTYPSLSLASDMPAIETVLINQLDGEAMGAGELSITLVPAAIGNAIFDATGARVRRMPYTPERMLEALKARP